MPSGRLRWNPWRGLGGLPREIWVLAIASLVNKAGTMVLPFFVLYLTRDAGFTTGHAGFFVLLYGAGALVAAPLLLVFCRLLQGFAVGGEWGGAALLLEQRGHAAGRGQAELHFRLTEHSIAGHPKPDACGSGQNAQQTRGEADPVCGRVRLG